jgi:hypothetical protein
MDEEQLKKQGIELLEKSLESVALRYDIREDFHFFDRYLGPLRDLYQERQATGVRDPVWGCFSDEDRIIKIDLIYKKEKDKYLAYLRREGYDTAVIESLKGGGER